MSFIQSSLRSAYRGIRRAAVLDVKRLLHLPSTLTVDWSVPSQYRLASLSADELEHRLAAGTAPASIGTPDRLADGRQDLIAAFTGSQIAAYVWLARNWVSATENFSRSRHLGTSLQLPEASVFVHTAFTEPAHRGRRLLGGMLGWARAGGVVEAERMFATMDWTNEPSRRAFTHLGFQPLGLIYRMGRGPIQCSLYPAAAAELGLQVATRCGGVRLAVG